MVSLKNGEVRSNLRTREDLQDACSTEFGDSGIVRDRIVSDRLPAPEELGAGSMATCAPEIGSPVFELTTIPWILDLDIACYGPGGIVCAVDANVDAIVNTGEAA